MKHFRVFVLLACALAAGAPPARAQSGTDSVRQAARAAVTRYERTARWLAPGKFGARGGMCDEVVGRFCLTFDSLSKPPKTPERPEVSAARTSALAKLRGLAAAAPGELAVAGPLVRLLVEARRPEEAVAAAATFAAATSEADWGAWLSGYALHAAGRDRDARRVFRESLAALPAEEREALTSPRWLLEPGERRSFGRLSGRERERWLERYWRLADPLWHTEENEVWVEHVARHIEARLLANVPLVLGMLHWGADLDQLTVRYGSPIARERDYGADSWSFIEHFDTSALAYAPERLRAEDLGAPVPGERWALRSPSARSSHAPPAVRLAVPLEHQLTRMPHGDSMIVRLDASAPLSRPAVPPDPGVARTTGAPAADAALIAWPWRGGPELRASAAAEAGSGDTAVLTLELRVPRDSMVYSGEVFESHARKLHRARYLVAPLPVRPVELSDVLLTTALAEGARTAESWRALATTVLPGAEQVGARVLVAGVRPGAPIAVEVSFARAESPSPLARAVGWVGRQLGLGTERAPSRIRWEEAVAEDQAVHVNLLAPARPGLYYLQVAVRAGAASAETRRLVRVVSGRAAGS